MKAITSATTYELLADAVTTRWQRLDELTKSVSAVFASGSVVAGWALWESSEGKTYWAILAGLVAVISIVHGALGVPSRVKNWTENKRQFVSCRLAFEAFYYRMLINPEFNVPDYEREFEERRKEYGAAILGFESDILNTQRIARKVQGVLDNRLRTKFIDTNVEPTHQ